MLAQAFLLGPLWLKLCVRETLGEVRFVSVHLSLSSTSSFVCFPLGSCECRRAGSVVADAAGGTSQLVLALSPLMCPNPLTHSPGPHTRYPRPSLSLRISSNVVGQKLERVLQTLVNVT